MGFGEVDDHAEVIRLRDRLHDIANTTTLALNELRKEILQVAGTVRVLEERIHALTEQSHAQMQTIERKIADQAAEHERQFGEQSDDTRALRRGVYTMAFSAIAAALVFALSVFTLLGH